MSSKVGKQTGLSLYIGTDVKCGLTWVSTKSRAASLVDSIAVVENNPDNLKRRSSLVIRLLRDGVASGMVDISVSWIFDLWCLGPGIIHVVPLPPFLQVSMRGGKEVGGDNGSRTQQVVFQGSKDIHQSWLITFRAAVVFATFCSCNILKNIAAQKTKSTRFP